MRLALAALGPLVAVAAFSSTARAAEEAEVVAAVQSKLDAVGAGALVICAAGEDTEKAVQRMVSGLSSTISVSRVPILGDIAAEAERIREKSGASCAVWVRPGTAAGAWDFGSTGPCTRPPETPSLGPVVVAEAPDTLDADPTETEAAPDSSPAADSTATVAPPPTVVLPPKLTVTDVARNPDDHNAVRWHVVDERGVSWSAYRFAETMGDTETLARLDRNLGAAEKERKVLFWTGIAGMALSPVPLLLTETGAYGKNADLAWTSLFLVSTGGLTFALNKVGEQSEKKRQLRPALYYSRGDSEALVSAYNAKIDAKQAELDAIQAAAEAAAQPAEPAEAPPDSDGSPDASAVSPEGSNEPAETAEASGEAVPANEAPSTDTPPAETPSTEAPPDETPSTEAPPDETPSEGAPPEATPLEDAPPTAPVDEAPAPPADPVERAPAEPVSPKSEPPAPVDPAPAEAAPSPSPTPEPVSPDAAGGAE